MSLLGLEKAAGLVAALLASQGWARWRGARVAQAQANRPLFDAVALEAALARCAREDGDPQLVAQVRACLRGRNRTGDAPALAADLVALARSLGPPDLALLRRCLAHLQTSPDSGLAHVAASALAEISSLPALPPCNAENAR